MNSKKHYLYKDPNIFSKSNNFFGNSILNETEDAYLTYQITINWILALAVTHQFITFWFLAVVNLYVTLHFKWLTNHVIADKTLWS